MKKICLAIFGVFLGLILFNSYDKNKILSFDNVEVLKVTIRPNGNVLEKDITIHKEHINNRINNFKIIDINHEKKYGHEISITGYDSSGNLIIVILISDERLEINDINYIIEKKEIDEFKDSLMDYLLS